MSTYKSIVAKKAPFTSENIDYNKVHTTSREVLL